MTKVYAIDGVIPVVAPSAFVHPTAVLTGDVIVGADCYVGPSASLRGDFGRIEMKQGSNFQDNCIAHCYSGGKIQIGERGNVGHGAVLHGCTIGDNALIGIGAVILNNAKIGNNCIIGSKALITENKVIPDNSLVIGSPGKVIREVTEEEKKAMAENTKHYQDNWKKYSKSIF